MDQTAITYPYTTLTEMSGETIKTMLEDVCDNLFNPDPYYQQGGDMVRVGGCSYTLRSGREDGQPHQRHAPQRQADRGRQELQGRRLGAGGRGSAERGRRADLGRSWRNTCASARWSKPVRLNLPRLVGMDRNPGIA